MSDRKVEHRLDQALQDTAHAMEALQDKIDSKRSRSEQRRVAMQQGASMPDIDQPLENGDNNARE